MLALCAVLALVAAACGSSRRNDATGGTGGNGTTPAGGQNVVDTADCPAGQDTVGVSGDTITIGTSLPQSGQYAPFIAILKGEKSYFEYLNAQGGVEVPKGSGKKYKIELVDKDDAYDAARTVTNVNSLINDTKVFSLFNVVGTKNNLGVRDTVNSDCVPDLLIASGAVQWGNMDFPWMLGSELVPYPLEMRVFVDYLKKNKPNATIAVLKASDDFGQSYAETLQELVKGTNLKIVQEQGYDPESSDVKAQVTSLAATKADAFVVGAALLACPSALNAMGDAGWKPIVYLSGTCVSKLLLGAAGKNADGLLTVTPLLDPADPANDEQPRDEAVHRAGEEVLGRRCLRWHRGVRLDHCGAHDEDPRELAQARSRFGHGNRAHAQRQRCRSPARQLDVGDERARTGSSVRRSSWSPTTARPPTRRRWARSRTSTGRPPSCHRSPCSISSRSQPAGRAPRGR